ncbi:NPXTG-anchored protein [Ruminococcus sp.]
MKKTRIFSTMLATVICMASLPAINVFAANQQRTTTLDLTTSEFQNDQKNEDEGWSWDADTLTLTLDNVDFSTAKKSCVIVDGEKVTNIVFSGDNKMTSGTTVISRKGSAKDTGVVLSGKTKDSVLNLEETGNSPSMDQPNITFESGTVDIQGGAAITLYTIKVMEAAVNIDTTMADPEDGWNDGLYANGSIEIYGGEVNVNAGRIGLFVVGIGAPEPKTGLIIEDGKLDINGKLADIYVGSGNTKNAVISGGDITLGGNIGIFLYDCEKCEIKGGTFHTDECEKPFAVHRDSSAVFEYAKADYTELDKAEETAKALNKDNYVDFTAVEKALEAIDRTKNLTQQSDVDKMAKDINDAVAALVYKSADYTELDKAEKAAKALNKDDYEDFSEVEKALAAIDRTKNITEQADVDAMAKAINDAVANLVKKAPASSQPDSENSSDNSSDISSSSAVDSSSSDSKATDSKSDSSSKAASNASNTNPSTGVAGGAFALALLSGAAVVMAKKKK